MPSTELRLGKATSLDDILTWPSRAPTDLHIRCNANADFAFATEAFALCALAAMRAAGTRLAVEYATEGQSARQRCLEGLFGLALLSAASAVKHTRTQGDVRSDSLKRVWQEVVETGGCIGSGRIQYLVAREPMQPVPPCLRGTEPGFPTRTEFRRFILSRIDAIKGRKSDSVFQTRDAELLLTFLYEATLNAYEHGRTDMSGHVVGGIHGVLIEKFLLRDEHEDPQSRRLDPIVGRYIEEQAAKATVFVAMTVVDVGLGIHHTLPPADDKPFERLNRAFWEGQTRKRALGGATAGLGLAKLMKAGRELRALLIVKSAELLGYHDFAASDQRDDLLLRPWPRASIAPTPGTAITLIVPETTNQLPLQF